MPHPYFLRDAGDAFARFRASFLLGLNVGIELLIAVKPKGEAGLMPATLLFKITISKIKRQLFVVLRSKSRCLKMLPLFKAWPI